MILEREAKKPELDLEQARTFVSPGLRTEEAMQCKG